jgi:hypothetical protein
MRLSVVWGVLILGVSWCAVPLAAEGSIVDGQTVDTTTVVSFSKDVSPIIKQYCLPCHAEDNYNPSELSLDTYDQLMAGGKHGIPVVRGKSEESIIVRKLSADPPFGKPMPLKKKRDPEQKVLTSDELKVIADWINQGAKNN